MAMAGLSIRASGGILVDNGGRSDRQAREQLKSIQ
jgi:hypothetical protein